MARKPGRAETAANDARPLGVAEFAAAMRAAHPFEPGPRLAVAVSGGADSMALMLCAARWAAGRGGAAVGLTVDHRLRRGSAREGAQVGEWLAARGIEHHRLTVDWPDGPPRGNVQGRARAVRYAKLAAWCRSKSVLHLLTGHHLDDQAETVLLRLARGSGVDGLAAMAPIVERADYRILRPMLGFPKARLVATLARAGQEWLDDPTNADPRHDRVALRSALPHLGELGLAPDRLAGTAAAMARARRALERETGTRLAEAARCHPAGFIRLARRALTQAPEELGLRLLARCLMTVSGSPYPPRLAALTGLRAAFAGPDRPRARTLAGCRIAMAGKSEILIAREAAAAAPPVALRPGTRQSWDGRFDIASPRGLPAGVRCGALGRLAGPERQRAVRDRVAPDLQVSALAAMPVFAKGRTLHVPDNFLSTPPTTGALAGLRIVWAPAQPLTALTFAEGPAR